MQTFLPYKSFEKTAKVLDNRRLGKQRVECLQILQTLEKGDLAKGWKNHPAVKMWRGHEQALILYGNAICQEWTDRGYKDSCRYKITLFAKKYPLNVTCKLPQWLGKSDFHSSHRSNLLRKFPEHYSQFGWEEKDNLPYIWPIQ